jgi:hypothetical protein
MLDVAGDLALVAARVEIATAKPRARRPFTMNGPVGPVPPITSARELTAPGRGSS